MPASAHSPLPFRVETQGPALRYRIVDANGEILATTYGNNALQKEDAAHIVLCVNSHDALVAEARYALAALEGTANPTAAIKGLRAALATLNA